MAAGSYMDASSTLRFKNMTEILTVAEGLRELKRIRDLLDQRYANISRYCSKHKGSKDEIDKQQEYVEKQTQSAKDLIVRYQNIKLAIAKVNLETTFDFQNVTYSVAQAILYKQFLKEMYSNLYNSFTSYNAERQLSSIRMSGLSDEQLEKYELIPELYYDERIVQKDKEDLLMLMSYLDALIDKANHATSITI